MKTIISIVAIVAGSLTLQAQTDARDLSAVVLASAGPTAVGGMTAETAALEPDEYAIADITVAGSSAAIAQFAHEQFGATIAAELVAAYGAVSKSPTRLQASRAGETPGATPVLDLSRFENGTHSYDWPRLNAEYPKVRAVIRVSRPAVVSEAYALAWYEVIAPNGRAWERVHKFEKRGDQTWVSTVVQIGDLWQVAPN